jgi:eukaryotic-like serine/threonine-protein kinase
LTTLGRSQIAVSPDGTLLAYVVDGRYFVHDLSRFDARAIGTFGQVAFSPDGRSLTVYVAADGTIKRLDVNGGAAVTVCRADNPFGMTWDASGIISGQGAKGILRCPLDGGRPEPLATVEQGEEADGPQLLPGGDTLLFAIATTSAGPSRWDDAQIVAHTLRSGERRTIVEGGSAPRYLASGHLVYARGGVLFAAPFDAARRQVTGRAIAVIEGVRRVASAATGGTQFTMSNTGHLFYLPGPANPRAVERALAVADRAGAVTRLPVAPGPFVLARASRDGTRLAIASDDGKDAAIWTYRLGGASTLQRLTLEGRNQFPVWSPDGERVAFQSDRGGDQAIFVQRVDGAGRAERLTKPQPGESHLPESWSGDGRYILFSRIKDPDVALWTLSVADGVLSAFGVTSGRRLGAVFSPDGRWVAYAAGRSGAAAGAVGSGVFIQPFPATGAIYQAPPMRLDFHPVWAPDGTELIYVPSAASYQLATVKVTAGAGVTFGVPATSPASVTAARLDGQPRAFDILPDGRLVGLIDAAEPDPSRSNALREIRVVLNWAEELKRLVPSN